MRALVIGASGLVGNALWQVLQGEYEVGGTFCSRPMPGLQHLDLTDPAEVRTVLGRFRPDVVLSPAAVPNVEYCETHPEQTWAINVEGTANLVAVVREQGARLVYFSSDYIFDGQDGPYAEDALPNPLSVYGRQKLACEQMIRVQVADHLVIRTTVVYGWEAAGKNFVVRLLGQLRAGRTVRAPVDQIGSPTYVRNLAHVVQELLAEGYRGTWNVVGPKLLDRYAFAGLVAHVYGLDAGLIAPVVTAELGQVAPRPLRGGLRVDKVQRALRRTRLLGPAEGLRAMQSEEERYGAERTGDPPGDI